MKLNLLSFSLEYVETKVDSFRDIDKNPKRAPEIQDCDPPYLPPPLGIFSML